MASAASTALAETPCQMSVSITPAAMALQVIWREATSRATERVKPIKPALEAA